MSWAEAYRNLHAAQRAGKSPAELWEAQRAAHWELVRAAWLRWQVLMNAHEAQGYNGRNPFLPWEEGGGLK